MEALLAVASNTRPQTLDRAERYCTVHRLGCVPYREAWMLQRQLVERRKAHEIPDTLLFVEHPSVITLGRNADRGHLLTPAEILEKQGVEVIETNRGGDITYHGPGQIVGYPILDLGRIRKDVVWYVRTLEEALIRTVGEFGIKAGRVAGKTGVWVGGAKVAAIGIHVSRWVTSHGFALNAETDLSWFRHIVPCGIAECPVTSLSELLGAPPERSYVEDTIARHLGELLGLEMRIGGTETVGLPELKGEMSHGH
jgi:lipoyl(octanoyl) transferase